MRRHNKQSNKLINWMLKQKKWNLCGTLLINICSFERFQRFINFRKLFSFKHEFQICCHSVDAIKKHKTFHIFNMIENNPFNSFISFRFGKICYEIYQVYLRLTENRNCFRVFHEKCQWYSQEIGFDKLYERVRGRGVQS